MKKNIALILLFALLAAMLVSCGEQKSPQHEISDYDSVSAVAPDDGQISGEITVKDKKYVFEGNDVVILDVQNGTDTDLSITINGTYLDESGNVLLTETKTFDQFYSGYQNYFLFNPKINFAKFTYTVESVKATEECFMKNVVVQVVKPNSGRAEKNAALVSGIGASNGNDFTITLGASIVFFNEKGDIVFIVHKTDPYTKNPTHPEFTTAYSEWNGFFIYTDTEHAIGNLELPEHLQGELTSVICVDIIKKGE